MLKMTCFKCHWTWTLTREGAQAALDSLDEDDKYYTIRCPQCGRANKVARQQLEHAVPPATPNSSD
jgi:DNA-directed RNA polymerase subunit RPC12/RpoP